MDTRLVYGLKRALRGRRAFPRLFTASRCPSGGGEQNFLPANGRPGWVSSKARPPLPLPSYLWLSLPKGICRR